MERDSHVCMYYECFVKHVYGNVETELLIYVVLIFLYIISRWSGWGREAMRDVDKFEIVCLRSWNMSNCCTRARHTSLISYRLYIQFKESPELRKVFVSIIWLDVWGRRPYPPEIKKSSFLFCMFNRFKNRRIYTTSTLLFPRECDKFFAVWGRRPYLPEIKTAYNTRVLLALSKPSKYV